ncbi:carboxypeptidase-like regulatory domain-containing protein [Maribacter sp. PR1]|uniref:Carboxypeptidase-like regulatory domain-containing protein n=1 Tax=Maribacter cobaltidurans TaxID=1178778 RepID=A0ABU7IXT5_9FLAO|nr:MULTISPECIES: carboxypeptidase-like regulatory domain-containing protein [Maribacter]MDC6390396.1 carboxypeptidase-like regulatory domain-containing protein [Maribacter sp. PR1]MEE1977785.1 carboxypeptidase-like regulatory domain-containing protein [Maribacter cobaltidurans]
MFGIFVGNGQESDFVRGRLLDRDTGEPIVFATVRIVGQAKGVITNMDGGFRLPQEYRQKEESIEISSMGYIKKIYNLQNLSPKDINIMYLDPGILSLSEAVVKGKKPKKLSAVQIVRRAIKYIPKNYPLKPFSSTGYYRDFQLKKKNYVNLNEAILEVLDLGFGTNDYLNSQVIVYDYHKNQDFEKDIEGMYKYDYKNYQKYIDKAYLFDYGGNEFTILRIHDAIRNYANNSFDFVNVMEKDFINNHFFKKEPEIKSGDESLFVVSFTKTLVKYRVIGKIYISKRNYGIFKFEYTLYDRTRTTEDKKIDQNGMYNEVLFKITTEYKKIYGKLYPSYISFFNTFQVGKPPKFILEETILDLECKCFRLTFNNHLDELYAKEKKYYDFKFKKNKIQIEKIKTLGEFEKEVLVYPKLTDKEFVIMANELNVVSRKRLKLSDLLTIEVTGLRDATPEANLINEMEYKTYEQYREFFVQETKPNTSNSKDTLFMKKDKPLFDNQPIHKNKDFGKYWMNTPLSDVVN